MSTPNGRPRRPLVSVTGPAAPPVFCSSFLRLTEKPELCGDKAERVVQKTGRVNDAHGIFQGEFGAGPISSLSLRSSPQLHPNHSAIASNYAFISKLCLGTALIFARPRERETRARTGRSALPPSLPPRAAISTSRAVSFEIHKAAAFSL